VFLVKNNAYNIWWALIHQTMNDFKFDDATHGATHKNEAKRYPNGNAKTSVAVLWTGITRTFARTTRVPQWTQSNADLRYTDGDAQAAYEGWPKNSPNIEMPEDSPTFKWKVDGVEIKTTVNETFRGYDMNMVGNTLQTWADTETVASSSESGAFRRFEYRVMSWFDTTQQIFRQRWLFGEMAFTDPNDPYKPTGILRGRIGRNTIETVDSENNLTFDYPGHIASWSLTESMEECATRIIVMDQEDAALKHAEYVTNDALLLVPNDTSAAGKATRGTQGWRLYDRVRAYDNHDQKVMRERGQRLLQIAHPPLAAQLSDLGTTQAGPHTSKRATDLAVTLHTDPSIPFPEFGLGDWATFAIEDPFYGGKMYLQRRIVGYSVAIDQEQESDYSNETITLELTDDTHISEDA